MGRTSGLRSGIVNNQEMPVYDLYLCTTTFVTRHINKFLKKVVCSDLDQEGKVSNSVLSAYPPTKRALT